jgi:hypothetical protein
MPTFHVYANLRANPVVYGVTTSDPPTTGGEIVHSLEHAQAGHSDLLRAARQLTGEAGSETFEASDAGLSEGLSMGNALAKHGRVRLVTAQGRVIRGW